MLPWYVVAADVAVAVVLLVAIAFIVAIELLRLRHLRLRRRDDAVVVLGVLEIILAGNPIAARLRVARELHVFLGHMQRGAANLHVAAVALVRALQGIGPLAVVAVAITHAATAALVVVVLLSWSHSQALFE